MGGTWNETTLDQLLCLSWDLIRYTFWSRNSPGGVFRSAQRPCKWTLRCYKSSCRWVSQPQEFSALQCWWQYYVWWFLWAAGEVTRWSSWECHRIYRAQIMTRMVGRLAVDFETSCWSSRTGNVSQRQGWPGLTLFNGAWQNAWVILPGGFWHCSTGMFTTFMFDTTTMTDFRNFRNFRNYIIWYWLLVFVIVSCHHFLSQ